MCIFANLKQPKGTYTHHMPKVTPKCPQSDPSPKVTQKWSKATFMYLQCSQRGAKPRGEVAKPKTELAYRDRFIQVASGL